LDEEIISADAFYTEQLVRMEYINTIHLMTVSLMVCTRTTISKIGFLQHMFDRVVDTSLLETLEIESSARIAVVLGRLFKMHPSFLQEVGSLLRRIDNHQQGSTDRLYVVIFAEKLSDFNRIIYERLEEITSRLCGNDSNCLRRTMNNLRIVSYDHYFDLLRLARVGIDTFPYGGELLGFCSALKGVF
jgi:hypothetical protein